MAYENVNFGTLGKRRLSTVREKIFNLWADGLTANEISKKVKVSTRSVSAAMANLTRNHVGKSPRR